MSEDNIKNNNIPEDATVYHNCNCGKLPKPICLGTINLNTKEFKPKSIELINTIKEDS